MANKKLDDYKPLKFYKDNSKARENGFAKFEQGGTHYFALYKDGGIALISQSYVNEAGRDNGIESVRKNSKIKARYDFDTRYGKKYGFSLKAGNSQEVAVSPSFATQKQAEHVAGRLNGSVKAAAKKKAAPKKKAPRKANDEDNYRPLAFYNKHTKGRKKGIESFKGDDGLYYFAVFENSKIRMISEGYPTTNALETGMASVEKNIKSAGRYDYRGPYKHNGKYDYRLKAGNGKEIARSIWYGSAATAATGAAYLMGTRKRAKPKVKAAPIVAAAAVAVAARPVPPRDKDDDYLKCEEYHGHAITDKAHNLAMFSHANNKEYFVIYDDDGDVLIRSEGFNSISKRSSELAAVLRLKDNSDNYERMEKSGYFMDILKDETGREVGRSCLRKIVPVAAAVPVVAAAPIAAAAVPAAATGGGWGWLKWLLLGLLALLALFLLSKCLGKPKVPPPPPPVACWDDSEAATQALCPKKVTCWDGSFVKNASACSVEPPKMITCWDGSEAKVAADCPVQETTSYSCWDGSSVTDLAACPPEKADPIVLPIVSPTDFGRTCGASSNVLFNVPNYTPKPVSYLGSNPQFGNSQGLSPQQFYNKLAAAHAAGGFDRAFLNLMARSLGYSGFSAMDASMFQDDTLAKGSKGMLGFGQQHALQYSTLNMSNPADLEAFRVTSANGTDVHIMKTCGNYMYVCR